MKKAGPLLDGAKVALALSFGTTGVSSILAPGGFCWADVVPHNACKALAVQNMAIAKGPKPSPHPKKL